MRVYLLENWKLKSRASYGAIKLKKYKCRTEFFRKESVNFNF